MKPSELAATLRRIASRIDASKSPSKERVSEDLKKVMASITRMAAGARAWYHIKFANAEESFIIYADSEDSARNMFWHHVSAKDPSLDISDFAYGDVESAECTKTETPNILSVP